ncbi:MAG: CBS domain-containing protein [Dictyoglomus sp.]|nr:CBS domain-containing protein [Dictyoglomus sp.]MCX7941547.1 CBS domain-containing protein [Dictyoglomaceae bacterium]MDW8187833.1 CBS domain-containing protein [Dictyoglomus sp.]
MKIPKEFFEGVKVKEIMNTDIVRVTPYHDMKSIQEIMRIKRIDGVPVINDFGKIIGLVTVENVISALVAGDLKTPCEKYMVKEPKCLNPEDNLYTALKLFRQYRFGRFPVVNDEGEVLGILSTKDIVLKLLTVEEKEVKIEKKSELEPLILEYPVLGGDFSSAGMASSTVKKALQQLGVDPSIIRRVAIITYEAEMNIVIHAYRGVLKVFLTPEVIEIIAEDEGPGIPDIELAMQPGYSTAPDNIREMGFGAGMGLPNIKNCSDELRIESIVGKGTKVISKIYLNKKS